LSKFFNQNFVGLFTFHFPSSCYISGHLFLLDKWHKSYWMKSTDHKVPRHTGLILSILLWVRRHF
jgi:hypothetical protein